MTYVGSLTIAVLVAPVFALYAGVSIDFALELTALISLSASIGIAIPDLIAQIAIAVQLNVGIQIAVAIGLPSVTASLALSLSAQLLLIEGLLVTLSGILEVGGASLQAYTYSGPGSSLGPAFTNAIVNQWPDGTPANDNCEALILAATSTGTYPAGELATLTLLGGGSNYERGLCSVTISGTATATPTIVSGAITGFTIASHGSGYTIPPTVTISDTVAITDATNASPIVVTIADTTDVTAVTIAGVQGNTAANGQWCAMVLSSTTIALYQDGAFTVPSVGNGSYTSGGMLTGNGAGAAAVPILGGGSIAQLAAFFSSLVFGNGLVQAGSLALSSICSATFELLLALQGELQFEAKLLATASANFGVVPPTIAGNLAIIGSIDANLTAALQLPLPSIQASLLAGVNGRAAVVLGLIAQIAAQLGCATEDLLIYTYSGPGSGLGAAISSTIGGGWPDSTSPQSQVSVVVLGATTPAASAALNVFFPAAA